MTSLTSQRRRSLIYPQGKVAVNYRALLLMDVIAPYEGFSLKARDQRMEGRQFEQGGTHVSLLVSIWGASPVGQPPTVV